MVPDSTAPVAPETVLQAAGMSAGNFYRYFPSKAAIVEALVARDLAEVEEAFQDSGDTNEQEVIDGLRKVSVSLQNLLLSSSL